LQLNAQVPDDVIPGNAPVVVTVGSFNVAGHGKAPRI
jgi:hypothetical protein